MENNNTDKTAQNASDTQVPPQPEGQNQYNYGYHQPYYPPIPPRRKKSDKPKTAGGLLIAAGILGLILASFMIIGGVYMGSIENFDMEDGGQVDITGVILAADGTPIDNVTLCIEGTHITVTTNSAGHYQMLGVPTGYQQLILEKPGYNSIIRHVYIILDINSDTESFGNQLVIYNDSELNFNMSVGNDTFTYGQEGEIFSMERMEIMVLVFGVIFMLCSIGAIIGGFYALKTEKYHIAMVGAVLGIFSLGFGIGTILSIAALIILLLSSGEFKKNGNGQS